MINFNAVAGVLRQTPSALAIASATMVLGSAAEASLFGFQTFNGNVKSSLDGACDGNAVCDGNISASVEGGSTVVAAYLYTSMVPTSATPTATLDGNSLSYTALGANNINLQAYRADVTSIVKPVIDSGGGGIYNFAYAEGNNNSSTDGSALVVVYENASLPNATVAILDGFSRAC